MVFRGRWVGPNSIFCRDYKRYRVAISVLDLGCSKWMSGRVINAESLNENKKIGLQQVEIENHKEQIKTNGLNPLQ